MICCAICGCIYLYNKMFFFSIRKIRNKKKTNYQASNKSVKAIPNSTKRISYIM